MIKSPFVKKDAFCEHKIFNYSYIWILLIYLSKSFSCRLEENTLSLWSLWFNIFASSSSSLDLNRCSRRRSASLNRYFILTRPWTLFHIKCSSLEPSLITSKWCNFYSMSFRKCSVILIFQHRFSYR